MKMPFAVVGAVALVARLASAAPVVVRTSDEKTYAVELVSADPKARTITIRSDKGPSNLVVDGKALDDIQRLKPGDKIAVTVRDDATGRRQIVTAIVNGSISTPPEVPAVDKTVMIEPSGTSVEFEASPGGSAEQLERPPRRTAGVVREFVNLDPTARKVTLLGDRGLKRVFAVDGKTMLSFNDLKPGQNVLLSYRFDREGKTEAVVRVTPAPALPPVRLETGNAVEVVSTDLSAKTLTVLREGGERQTLLVDDSAVGLNELKTGESILVTLKDGKVAVITRTR